MTSKKVIKISILLAVLFVMWISVNRIAVARTIAAPNASAMSILKIAANTKYVIAAPHQQLFTLFFKLPVVYAQTGVCSANCSKGIGQTGYEPQSTTTPGCFPGNNSCPGCNGPCHTYTCEFTGTSKTCQQWTISEGVNAPCNGCHNADSCKP
jgi:hypothetical protein